MPLHGGRASPMPELLARGPGRGGAAHRPLAARRCRAELADATLPSVRSDRQKVKQIVLNLLTNALKFTPQGSVTVTAALRRRRRARSTIAVTDTGIGIANEGPGA